MEVQPNHLIQFDIFKALEIAKIYAGTNIIIQLNNSIAHFDRIAKIFDNYGIKYTAYTPATGRPSRFDIHIGKATDFQDLFIIVAILKNFGLQAIFFERDDRNIICIGSYLAKQGGRLDPDEGITADTLLQLPFYTTTKELIALILSLEKKHESAEDQDEDDEMEDYNNEYDYDDVYNVDDEPYMTGDPRHDTSENPWIDVFGPGDEAETAYWNTQ